MNRGGSHKKRAFTAAQHVPLVAVLQRGGKGSSGYSRGRDKDVGTRYIRFTRPNTLYTRAYANIIAGVCVTYRHGQLRACDDNIRVGIARRLELRLLVCRLFRLHPLLPRQRSPPKPPLAAVSVVALVCESFGDVLKLNKFRNIWLHFKPWRVRVGE